MRGLWLAMVLLVGGCSQEHTETAEEIQLRHKQTCRSYGFFPGTPSYDTCMETQARQDQGEFSPAASSKSKGKTRRRMG